jgi:putative nucleotidyltransferase with HDIG domain
VTDAGKRTLPTPADGQTRRGAAFYAVFGLVVGGGILGLATSPFDWEFPLGLAAVLWCLMVGADLVPVLLPRGGYSTPGAAVDFAALLLLGPAAAAWLVVSSALLSQLLVLRRPPERAVFNSGLYAIMVLAAGRVFGALGGVPGALDLPADLPATAAAAVAYFGVNALGVSLVLGLTQGLSPWRVLQRNYLSPSFAHLGTLAVGAASALLYLRAGGWGVVVFAVPLAAASLGLRRYFEMRRDLLEFVRALAGIIEEVDPYTRRHSTRVAEYAKTVARELGVPERDIEDIEYGALLHDLGKVGRQYQRILAKPARLSHEEQVIIRFHPDQGADILARVRSLARAAEYVRCHHERMDGAGYPRGVGGEDLPLGARIIGVCDAFDAMTSERAYRGARGVADALVELGRCAGSQFDPRVVQALDRLVEKRALPAAEAEPAGARRTVAVGGGAPAPAWRTEAAVAVAREASG